MHMCPRKNTRIKTVTQLHLPMQGGKKESAPHLLLTYYTSFTTISSCFFSPFHPLHHPPSFSLSSPPQQSQAPIRLSPYTSQVPLRKPDWGLSQTLLLVVQCLYGSVCAHVCVCLCVRLLVSWSQEERRIKTFISL